MDEDGDLPPERLMGQGARASARDEAVPGPFCREKSLFKRGEETMQRYCLLSTEPESPLSVLLFVLSSVVKQGPFLLHLRTDYIASKCRFYAAVLKLLDIVSLQFVLSDLLCY